MAQITTGTLSKIETGSASCAWSTVIQIIDALDVSLVRLAKAIETERKIRRSQPPPVTNECSGVCAR